MSAFLDICDYFEITPLEFFDPAISNPPLFQTVMNDIKTLSEDDLLILSLVLKRIISNTKC